MSGKFQTIKPENSVLKAGAKTVLALLAALLAGAIIFYKERMLFIDAPHVLFRVINDGHFHIEEARYGSFITQLFPLLGAKLHIPFTALAILYSAGFYLFYLAVALLLVFKYRNYGLAILFGLYLTLFVSDTYYWPNNEVHQGIAWLMLAIALNFYIASNKRPIPIAFLLFPIFFALAIWTHPLVVFVAIYLWVFYWMDKTYWPYSRTQSLIFTVILLVLSYLKYNQGMHHGYDSTKIEVVTNFDVHKIKAIFTSPQFHFFIRGCISNYWLFVLLSIAGLVGLIKEKKYLLLAWTVLFATAYLVLVCITFWDGTSNRFYIESEYMPLSIICCAPFVYYVLPKLSRNIGVATVLLIFVIRLLYIYNAAPLFTSRLVLLEKINAKMKEKNFTKVMMPGMVPAVDSVLIMSWGAQVESIILSKLDGEIPQRTFLFADPAQINMANTIGKDTLLGCWEVRAIPLLNNFYFQVDTTTPYKVMTYNSLME